MTDLTPLPAYRNEELEKSDLPGLIQLMIADEDRVPRNVIDECARRGEAMVGKLSDLLEDKREWQAKAAGEWWLILHAVMILGLIPGERAGLLLVKYMRRISREEDEDLQDWLASCWTALFLNKPQTALPALRALGEDLGVDWYIRACATESYIAAAYHQGNDALDSALAWLAKIVANEKDDWDMRLCAADTLLNLPRRQYRPLLEEMAARQSGLGSHFAIEDIQKAYTTMQDQPAWKRFSDPWAFYSPEDIAARTQRWTKEEEEGDAAEWADANYDDEAFLPETYIREQPKIGRNDPCPCGSGKKYKQCCQKNQQAQPEDDFLWRRIRRAIEGSPPKLLSFGASHFGQDALLEAWDEFMLWENEPFTPDTPHMTIFMPWYFYDWLPAPIETSVRQEALDGRTLARAYLDKKGKQLDPLLVRYMEQCCLSPFSFYDVLSVNPGTGFLLRDIMTGAEINVTEQAASCQTRAGDILFAKLASIDQVTLMEACAPVMFPPIEKAPILELRNEILARELPLTPELLKDYDFEMLEIYHDITERLLNPPMPQLQNTDGEPMLLHKLIYQLECSPQQAFDALRPLDLIEDDDSIMTGATFKPSGEVHSVKFAWHKPGNKMHKDWNNTILGHLHIEGAKLTAEVNSENRAQKFKTLMEKLLPGKARYKTTVIESPQAMLARAEKEVDTPRARQQQKEQDELNNLPEVQAQIADYMRQHYRDWPSQKLPILKGKTALQAVKTKDGKEMVEALLMDIERRGQQTTPPLDPAIIAELRERLGLA